MTYQGFRRERPAEYEVRRFLLQIDGSAIRPAQRSLLHTDARTGDIDSFLVRGLRKEQNPRSRTRATHRLLDDSWGGSGHNDDVRATSVRHGPDGCIEFVFSRIECFQSSESFR